MSEDMRGWWQDKESKLRRFVTGLSHDETQVHYYTAFLDRCVLSRDGFLQRFERCPPECNSFNWVPPVEKVWRDATAADWPKHWGARARVSDSSGDWSFEKQRLVTWDGFNPDSINPFGCAATGTWWRYLQILVEPGQ